MSFHIMLKHCDGGGGDDDDDDEEEEEEEEEESKRGFNLSFLLSF